MGGTPVEARTTSSIVAAVDGTVAAYAMMLLVRSRTVATIA